MVHGGATLREASIGVAPENMNTSDNSKRAIRTLVSSKGFGDGECGFDEEGAYFVTKTAQSRDQFWHKAVKFELLADTTATAAYREVANTANPAKSEIWLPGPDSNQRPSG